MTPSPFVVASKASVIQKLLEGDRETLVFLVVGLAVASGILFVAARARRAINARRGRSLHAELEGSTLTEHPSGELIFEIQWAHAGIETRICGHQTGRKLEHTSFTLPLPLDWSPTQLLDGLKKASDAMEYFTAEAHGDGVRFRCEGIGLPGEFFAGILKLTSGVIDLVQVDAAHTAATPAGSIPSHSLVPVQRPTTVVTAKLGGRLLESPPSAEQLDELVAAVVAGREEFLILDGDDGSYIQTATSRTRPQHLVAEYQHPSPDGPRHFRFTTFSGDTELDPETVLAHFRSYMRFGIVGSGSAMMDVTDELFSAPPVTDASASDDPETAGTEPTADRPPPSPAQQEHIQHHAEVLAYHTTGSADFEATCLRFAEHFEVRVPERGQASTTSGEVLRCVSRLAGEDRRNGNMNWDDDFEQMVDFLERTLPEDPRIARDLAAVRANGRDEAGRVDCRVVFGRLIEDAVAYCDSPAAGEP